MSRLFCFLRVSGIHAVHIVGADSQCRSAVQRDLAIIDARFSHYDANKSGVLEKSQVRALPVTGEDDGIVQN